jgi:hypothetical protein
MSMVVAEKLAHKNNDLVPSSSKFDALSTFDESNEKNSAVGSVDWWRNGSRPKLTPTTDGFVQIMLPRSLQPADDEKSNPKAFSLHAIAAELLGESGETSTAYKKPDENEVKNDWSEDESY